MDIQARRRRCIQLLVLLAVLSVLVLLLVGPIPEDPDYHAFADDRALLGVSNALDVLSNLAFTVVGVAGIAWLAARGRKRFLYPAEWVAACVFFGAVALVGLGSAWYHLAPSNASLVWDRLPLAVATVGAFCLILAERVSPRWGGRLLGPLVLFALASVLYWIVTEGLDRGDLRPYALAQYYPGAAIVVILLTCPTPYTRGMDYAWVVGWYAFAKVFEFLDHAILDATGIVSGHTIKHLVAAMAAAWLLRMLHLRRTRCTAH